MTYPYLMRTALIAATLGAGGVLAQTSPVRSDVGPPPAEDRSSVGAIVLPIVRYVMPVILVALLIFSIFGTSMRFL